MMASKGKSEPKSKKLQFKENVRSRQACSVRFRQEVAITLPSTPWDKPGADQVTLTASPWRDAEAKT